MPGQIMEHFDEEIITNYSSDENSEPTVERNEILDNILCSGIGRALQIESNVFKIDHAVIIKAPVMAVSTESGFTFEVVTDTGAEVSIISDSVVRGIGVRVDKTCSRANQVNKMPLNVTGMITIPVMHGQFKWIFNALVCSGVGDICIAGNPMLCQGITPMPSKRCILVENGNLRQKIPWRPDFATNGNQNMSHVGILRSDTACTVFPGDFVRLKAPPSIAMLGDAKIFITPRNSKARMYFQDENKSRFEETLFPLPRISHVINGDIYLPNSSNFPVNISRNDQLADIRLISNPGKSQVNVMSGVFRTSVTDEFYARPKPSTPVCQIEKIQLDPDNILRPEERKLFLSVIHKFKDSFTTKLGRYNGELGNLDAKVVLNSRGVEPPSFPFRKLCQPEALNQKQQEVMDAMEADGILVRPEDVGIVPTHVHPSFMVPKLDDGTFTGEYRLVTGLSSLSPFLKPSRVPLPTVEEAFRKLAKWPYLIMADLKSWHWQIPLNKDSMRFFGTATPYGGLRLYAMQPMGYLNATENADLVIQSVLAPAIQQGRCTRIADNLFTGGQTGKEAADNFHMMLNLCANSGLTFKASKTVICPRSVTILGKVWEQGTLKPSNHLLSTLSKSDYPRTVKQMRSFTGTVKQMKDNLPQYHLLLHPLERACAGLKSADHITWTDVLTEAFDLVKKAAANPEALTLPKQGEKLFIFPDWSDIHQAGAAPLFVRRGSKLLKVRNFGQRLNTVKRWAPCEGESWIARISVEAHGPWLWEALPARTELNSDNMPTVLAARKLQRGEFSRSVRITYFLSALAAFPVDVVYRKGDGHPGDYDSRHTIACDEKKCQVCEFAFDLAGPTSLESMFKDDTMTQINNVTADDIISGRVSVPFSQANGWKNIQEENPTLRKLKFHMEGGTIPKRRVRGQTELKRLYDLFTKNKISVSREGVLVHQEFDHLGNNTETILVPSQIMKGLVLALHNKFKCPTRLELGKIMKRYWFALGMIKVIEEVWLSCQSCQAAKKVPKEIFGQSTVPTDTFGKHWAADVVRGDLQFILLAREKLSSFTVAQLVHSEDQEQLRAAIILVTAELIAQDGLVLQVDNCPAFQALQGDAELARQGIKLDLGREKNKNSNPIAEKCVREFRDEKKRIKPHGGPVTAVELAVIVASLNRRVRNRNVSAREILTGRDQITNKSLELNDVDLAKKQLEMRTNNHPVSARSKAGTDKFAQEAPVWPGALVFIKQDLNKLRTRETYIVVKMEDDHSCFIKKLENQCRSKNYKVKLTEIELLPNQSRTDDIVNEEEPTNDSDEASEEVTNDVRIPLKERTTNEKYSLRKRQRPDYKLMNEGPQIARVLGDGVIPPKYGWDTQAELTSSDEETGNLEVEVAATDSDDNVSVSNDASPLGAEFVSPQRSFDWDNYQSPPSFSTASLEKVLGVLDLENINYDGSDEDEEPFAREDDGVTIRRSTRVRKPYSYRGIDDYVPNDGDDDTEEEIWTDADRDDIDFIPRTFRPTRTLTEDSRLGEVVIKGNVAKDRRKKIVAVGPLNKKIRKPDQIDVQLPCSSVLNFDAILNPRRPQLPELVVTERCQSLDDALDRVLLPRVDGGVGGQEAAGGEEQEGGPLGGGGVRQCDNL